MVDKYGYGNPVKFNDPSGHFTEDAIKDYLKETHKDTWEEYWKLWSADAAWMDMLYKATACDVFASISTSGLVSWHQFTGEGVTSLTGANELNLNGGATLFAGVMLDVVRPGSNGTIAGGLLRANADNSFQLVPTLPSPDSNLTLALHTVGGFESFGWRAARTVGIGATSSGVEWGIGKAIGKQISFIPSLLISAAYELSVDATSDDFGFQAGDQQIKLRQLTTNYQGEFTTRQLNTWWWRPPQPSNFVAR